MVTSECETEGHVYELRYILLGQDDQETYASICIFCHHVYEI